MAPNASPLAIWVHLLTRRNNQDTTEQGGRYNTLHNNITVGDLATALNMLGVTPQDMISVFQQIRTEGGLQAELILE